ncbi:helix-turn-helix domain-containing protein [Mammaliicoccus sciuri]|uniref:helix-turn-helix domain-containing protein n=1 Tax=Mammaliicoccus sciuri TaxID=1296 RepID=UPI002DB5CD51|nr:helix-turn-helix transcriptional regulator [Mammaliicoccus sciuri]MEB7408033.1 helix-turn-helix domain-containing protein [Mammaliicoccus sciuri]
MIIVYDLFNLKELKNIPREFIKGEGFMICLKNPKQFREIIYKKGLSNSGLSKKANVSAATIHNLTHELSFITPITAKKICDALDLDFDVIFRIIENDTTKKSTLA